MHTRGRQIAIVLAAAATGTTHAHAGQTPPGPPGTLASRNHPCTRGADSEAPWLLAVDEEPPMHTRGRRFHTPRVTLYTGTTHAHAGQTRSFYGS